MSRLQGNGYYGVTGSDKPAHFKNSTKFFTWGNVVKPRETAGFLIRNRKSHGVDSGSQKVQHRLGGFINKIDSTSIITKTVHKENSSELSCGRRPKPKSDKFFV